MPTKKAFLLAVMQANPGILAQWKRETGEYRVSFQELSPVAVGGEDSPRERSAYYTADAEDAAATAKAMWDQRYRPVAVWLTQQPDDYLRRCAEGEGGRAALCVQGFGSPDTAFFFARSAAMYARVLLNGQID